MEHHVGIDVSLELSSLCVLDGTWKAIREAKVASEPDALVAFLRGLGATIARVGLEAGPLSQWFCQHSRQSAWSAYFALRYRVGFGREPVGCGVWSAARQPFRNGRSAPPTATAGSGVAAAASSSMSAAWGC
jgi:hypothetical protein